MMDKKRRQEIRHAAGICRMGIAQPHQVKIIAPMFAETELALMDAIEVIENLLKVIDDLAPGVAGISLKDYQAFNEVPLKAQALVRDLK